MVRSLLKKYVLIIDYGVGNILSIVNALNFLGYNFIVSNKKEDIINACAYILPGVGAFAEAMNNLHQLKIINVLHEQVFINKKPILGICLGMQMLAESSEEKGFHQGLGWIKGKVVKINSKDLQVPHVGWNEIEIKKKHPLFTRTNSNPHFYFDHSYHFICESSAIAAKFAYGNKMVAAVQKDNIFGVQFHPEKSQNNGLRLYRGFFNYIKQMEKNRQC
jgi:imidazole glycerol-phosphate synthase subunit HisH